MEGTALTTVIDFGVSGGGFWAAFFFFFGAGVEAGVSVLGTSGVGGGGCCSFFMGFRSTSSSKV